MRKPDIDKDTLLPVCCGSDMMGLTKACEKCKFSYICVEEHRRFHSRDLMGVK